VDMSGFDVTLELADGRTPLKYGDDLTVIGIGKLAEDRNIADALRDVDVPFLNPRECEDVYGGFFKPDMMCTAGNKQGSCGGDSGGPVVLKDGKTHIQVGVVSYGWKDGCATRNKPDGNADVRYAREWIEEVVCDKWNRPASFCSDDDDDDDDDINECVDFKMVFKTDDWPEDSSFTLTNGNDVLWKENDFDDSKKKFTFNACVSPRKCTKLEFSDSGGDGLHKPGKVKVYYGGKKVYKGRDFGNGFTYEVNCS